ncbi:MAG: hypothetical protein ACYDAS_00950 [Patescibacteria group bacterium]
MKLHLLKEDKRGQAALISVIILSAILLATITAISSIAVNEYVLSSNDILSGQIKYFAESGIENALLQIGESNNTYTGGSFVSPINTTLNGTDNVTVSYNTNVTPNQATITSDATITSPAGAILTTKTIQVVASLGQNPAIDNYGLFANNSIYTDYTQVQGDIQSNNLLYMTNGSITAQAINAVGNGSGFANYLDNMTISNTGGLLNLNSNYISCFIYNSSVSGELGYGESIFGIPLCLVSNSTIGSEAQVSAPPQISLPTFDTPTWKSYAQTNGTYFSNATKFYAYLENYSTVSDGIDTMSPPPGVYYIDSSSNQQTLPYQDSSGDQITYNFTGSTVIIKNGLQTYAGWVQTDPFKDPSTGKYLPAIITGKQGLTISNNVNNIPSGINITGIVYSPGTIQIIGYNPASTIDASVNGAIWSGNQVQLGSSNTNKDINVGVSINSSIITNTEGFNLSNTKMSLISWQSLN